MASLRVLSCSLPMPVSDACSFTVYYLLLTLTPPSVARGFTRQGQGNPDESRSARYIFKDYVSARLLYAHPPPGVDADAFNAAQRDAARAALAGRRYAPILAEHEEAAALAAAKNKSSAKPQQGARSKAIDTAFFEQPEAAKPSTKGRSALVPVGIRPGRMNADGTPANVAPGVDEAQIRSKKHFKGKKGKQRSGQGFA